MIPNIHQSIDEIIKASSSEEKIIWQHVRLITGENAAIQQLYYAGLVAGSVYATYVARTIYFAYSITVGRSNNQQVPGIRFSVYNELNGLVLQLSNHSNIWNATAAAVHSYANSFDLRNIIFGKIENSGGYDYVKIIGYKIVY